MTPEGQVRAFLRREGILQDGREQVLCAVSGGTDSMCLLHLLWQESLRTGFALSAAVFDHHLRPASAEEVRFVRAWCAERRIPCRCGGGDVAAAAAEQGLTLEEAGRLLRYEFLERCRTELGADYIATAHNADDNAETLLLHLLRGTGLQGLGGIPPRRGIIIRPLLEVSRAEIAAYCARNHVPHREDESNRDTAYTRNYLRHEVLPLLRAKNPSIVGTLTRTAQTLRLDEQYLSGETARLAGALLEQRDGAVTVAAPQLRALPEALALRLAQEMAQRVCPGTVLPWNQRQALLALVREKKTGTLSLANRLQGRLVYDMLTLSRAGETPGRFSPVELRAGQGAALPETGLYVSCTAVCAEAVSERERGNSPPADPNPGGAAAGTVSRTLPGTVLLVRPPEGGVLLIRPRRAGDRLLLPRRPEKTLKKLFQEAKLPPERRDQIPVLDCGGAVAGVYGFGTDRRWRPLPGEAAWRIKFIRQETEKGSV